jgi:predicted acylesterase/phospholipase RssA
MSLSFYFIPVKDPLTGNYLTDGGALNNYPMVFLTEEEQRHAIGLMFSGTHTEDKKIETLFDFMLQLYACVYMPRIRHITKTLADRTILLPHGDYPAWNFEATEEERIHLIQGAAKATEEFLQKGNQVKPFRRYSVS